MRTTKSFPRSSSSLRRQRSIWRWIPAFAGMTEGAGMTRGAGMTAVLLVTAVAYLNIFQNGFVIDDQYFIVEKSADPVSQQGVFRPVRSLLYTVYFQIFGTSNPAGYHLHSLLVHLVGTGLVYLIMGVIARSTRRSDPVSGLPREYLPANATYQALQAGARNDENESNAPCSSTICPPLNLRGGKGELLDLPFIAALLFGLHPVHTESITYMAASMEMTGIVFMLASFYFYITPWSFPRSSSSLRRQGSIWRWIPAFAGMTEGAGMTDIRHILSILFATLAFFTYEMALTLPLLILWYEFLDTPGKGVKNRAPTVIPAKAGIYKEMDPPIKGTIKPAFAGMTRGAGMVRKIWPYFGVLVLYLISRFLMGVGMARGEYLAYSPYHTFLTMTKMVVKYIWLLIWPVNLSHNHTVVPEFEAFMTQYSDQAAILRQSILDPEILLSFMVIIGTLAFAVIHRKKKPMVSFGIGWFFISLLPVLYIFPQGTAIAEKYLYLASFGFILVISDLIGNLYRWIPASAGMTKGAGMTKILFCLIVLFYGGRTYLRNKDWRSPITLWEHETVIHPKSELAFYSLGVYYGQSGQKEKAAEAYVKALELKPQFWQAENNLRNLLR